MPKPDKPEAGGNKPAEGDKPADGDNKVTTNIREVEELRIKAAFWLAVIGLGLAASLTFVLIANGKGGTEITSVVGLFTSVLGTLVGAFFGLQIGSAGTATAQQQAADAQQQTADANNKANAFAGAMKPEDLKAAIENYKRLSEK